jgi:hypothetical protein
MSDKLLLTLIAVLLIIGMLIDGCERDRAGHMIPVEATHVR